MFGLTPSINGESGSGRGKIGVGSAAVAIMLCIAVTANIGCKKPEQKAASERSINVRVWTAEKRALRPFVESLGTLKPYEEVIVSSEVDGILQSIRVDEAAPVSRGQLIAEMNDADYRLDAERAAAVLKQAEASLANAKQEYERKEALYREELLTKQQFDDISARLILAQGDVERAKVGLALAREKLAKTKAFAPMTGVVKEKRVTAGDYIRNGTFLVSIIRTDQLKLVFSVPEKDIGNLREGQDVVFTVDAFPGREFRGKLTTIYPALEEKTRSLQVEAAVANPDRSLKPGLFARVTLYTGPARDAVLAPITALLYDNSETKLFVVEGDRAKERRVKTGRKYGEFMEITEGLKAKEVIVTVGQNNLMEGVQVNVAR
ncbi:MAG: efflux RND transporter periplasmic adaptor subunit [Proteobacteria bacterium]|nr:efflux RND transporter periplasmic adaptor subunit [Pseudomonadota bacterium]MBU2227007.1 efflux RND transporter periplasmic adaptor subunit [Pseudomonadota bacterium]MBU2262678.1 efflux RND transporter periplasmic adaptor subunit [Pseudomonadota bacterium]